MSKKVRLYVLIGTVAAVLLGAGIVVGVHLFTDRVNAAVPQADLFGPSTPPATTGGTPSAVPSPTPPAGADIKGPLNILIVGLDTREDEPAWPPHADAVMIMHVSADLQSAYLTSLPRDLVVDIPPYPPSHFNGERSKLTHAFTFGAAVAGSSIPNPVEGFPLLAKTVSTYTHIDHFDAGAVLTFSGLRNVVNAMGGIDMYIDQQVESIHLMPDASGRAHCPSCPHGVTGPAATYNADTTMHLVGWQALDYARQRYLAGGDYSRQRHQRQLITAIMTKIIGSGYLMAMARIDDLVSSLGTFLLFDGRGRKPTEFAYALRDLTPDKVTLVGLPGTGAYANGAYIGEDLTGIAAPYFAALTADTLPAFLAANPSLLNKASAG